MQVALSTDWQHAIILTNAGLLLIGPLGTNFVLSLGLQGLYRVTNCIDNIVGCYATAAIELKRKCRLINKTIENMASIIAWKL